MSQDFRPPPPLSKGGRYSHAAVRKGEIFIALGGEIFIGEGGGGGRKTWDTGLFLNKSLTISLFSVPTLRTRSGSGTSLGSGKSDDEDNTNKEQTVKA